MTSDYLISSRNPDDAYTSDILVYTRKPDDIYTASLAGSVHFAVRYDCDSNDEFMPLNSNYGILFPEAAINEQNVICEKNLKNPYIFRLRNGVFGIIAVRTAKNGIDDEESRGCVLLWTSKDLLEFTYHGLIRLHDSTYVETAICEYNDLIGKYEINWKDKQGNAYINYPDDITDAHIPDPQKTDALIVTPPEVSIPGINPGNILQAEPGIIKAMINHWTPPYHVKTEVPDEVTISSAGQLDDIKATAVYSDGSTADKRVKWNTENIDFSKPGEYIVKGTATTPKYDFPLARGYADPVILPWEGKYYYIATNDNKNDIGLYVRVSDTIEGLFAEGFNETIILDADEEKGFVQTFWAPEFHLIGGELYILFAVGGKQWGPQCHSMKLKKGGSIINPQDWETPVRTKRSDGSYLAEDGITLDMTYFTAEGKSYAVWSYRYGIGSPLDTGSMIYIAQTDEKDPTMLISQPVLLTRPLLGWENVQGTINNEGPYPLVTDDTVYIAYSGGAARGYTYSIGLMSIPRGSDYLDITKWKKAVTPVVNYLSFNGLYGAGHNSFFTDYDGNVMIAYHAEEEIVGHGLACSAMHRVHFRNDGTPVFNMSPGKDLDDRLAEVQVKLKVKVL